MSQPSGWGEPAGQPEQPSAPGQWGQAPQWGGQQAPPGYGTPPPGYGTPPPGYGTPPPGYGTPPPGYGTPPPGYGTPPGAPPPSGPGYAYGWRPRPGIIPLRPITLGEIFDGGFQAIRTNPRTMLGFSALVLVIVTVLSLIPQAFVFSSLGSKLSGTANPTLDESIGVLSASLQATLIPAFIQYLAVTVLTALLTVAVSGAVLGQKMPPRLLWDRVRPRLWAVFGLTLLQPLLIGLIFVIPAGLGVALVALDQGGAGILGVVVLVLAGALVATFVGVRWSLSGPALLLENQRVVPALRRSWRLVGGSWWRVWWILLLTQILVGIGSGIVGAPFSLLGGLFTGPGLDGNFGSLITGLVLSGLGQIVAGTVFYPFTAAVTALLYVDLRMRREGLDVQLMEAAAAPGQAG